ncbi:SDR family NAD(P)-dependent oxidoreductase [Lutimaribacter marinistellae]|uniref:SDR family NAD(P)-dependent oxidoreductase n=1 Tax=Lutimaribacter marinistellae TaxID=1820329 RepID=A0ABV7TLM9_9RHOB
MTDWAGKRYWLVGASAGLGEALARHMSRMGIRLVLSARSEDELNSLSQELPGPSEVVTMDVSDPDSVRAAAERVGEVDGLIFLAGAYWPMKTQAWDFEQANIMADVNFTGMMRVMGVAVPSMVARDAGHIVITGSLSGYRGLPKAIGYAASKAGVMRLAECMHADLRNTGVRVQLVNPGFIRTRLTDKNDFNMPFLMEADEAAARIFEHMCTDRFRRDFPMRLSAIIGLGRMLPDWLYYRLFA